MKQTILNYLRDSFGLEGDDAKDLYDSYKSALEEQTAKFDILLSSGDFSDLVRVGHTIKGCAMNCGDSEMAQEAISMEASAKEGDSAAVAAKCNKIKELQSQI